MEQQQQQQDQQEQQQQQQDQQEQQQQQDQQEQQQQLRQQLREQQRQLQRLYLGRITLGTPWAFRRRQLICILLLNSSGRHIPPHIALEILRLRSYVPPRRRFRRRSQYDED
jgi:hypothetical protein